MKSTEPGFSEWATSVFDEIESECSGNEGDIIDPDLQSDHDSASEQEASDNEDELSCVPGHSSRAPSVVSSSLSYGHYETDSPYLSDDNEPLAKKQKRLRKQAKYHGKNGFVWAKQAPSSNTRTRRHNIITHLPGRIGLARALGPLCRPRSAWELLFSEEILNEIVRRTNEKLVIIRETLSDDARTDYKDTYLVEFKAFLGILMFTAIFKSNNEDLAAMFATDGTGRDIFRCTMALKRVYVLLLSLRFDDALDREDRKKNDATAAISWVFQKFLENCRNCYSIGEYACIDEMLLGFRGRCRFRMYIPNKPRKYGIKIMALTDAKTHYLLNAYIYSGKDSDGRTLTDDERKFPKSTQAVLRLTETIVGTNRNITADNWFSSIDLVHELSKRGLTYVGTLRKNKREIPKEFLPAKQREEGDILYGFTNDMTLVSFVPKKCKAVLLVSSMHHTPATDPETQKPEIITFYNSTKGGVDALDEKCTVYSTSRRTRRWPLAIFYTLMNISMVNSYIIYSACPENPSTTRLKYIKMLAKELVEPYQNHRLLNKHLPRELRLNISRILQKPLSQDVRQELDKHVRCRRCPPGSDKKTRKLCNTCNVPICGKCTVSMCRECVE